MNEPLVIHMFLEVVLTVVTIIIAWLVRKGLAKLDRLEPFMIMSQLCFDHISKDNPQMVEAFNSVMIARGTPQFKLVRHAKKAGV